MSDKLDHRSPEFQAALEKYMAEQEARVAACDGHKAYRGFDKDGRCCPTCGAFVVDWGD